MSARPILFSAPWVRAILDGRKTQTRRIIAGDVLGGGVKPEHCPHGQPGDLLWVREAFCLEHETEGSHPPHNDGRPIQRNADAFDGAPGWIQPHYRATDPEPELAYEYGTCPRCEARAPHAHWRPSIHMPRWASRLTLRITDVRVERLQDITAADALAEGVQIPVSADTGNPLLDIGSRYAPARYLTPAQARTFDRDAWLIAHYASQWDTLYTPRGHAWADNPWVWAITFEPLETAP